MSLLNKQLDLSKLLSAITDLFLKWTIIVSLLLFTSFLTFSIKELYFPTVVADVTKATTSEISNEALLGILTLLVAFGGLLSFVFRKLVLAEIHDEIKKSAREERIASKIEARIVSASMMGILYEVENGFNEDAKKSFLSKAHHYSITAFDLTGLLYTNNHIDVVLKAKNNLAYTLVLRHRAGQTIEKRELALVESIRSDLWNVLTNKSNHYHDVTNKQLMEMEDTITQIDLEFNFT